MSWKEVRLKEVIEKPISGEWGTEGDSVYVLRTTNFSNNGSLDLSNVIKRNIAQHTIDKKKLRYGDTILEKSGGSPNQPVGRVVYFNIDNGHPYLCNNFTTILRPTEKICSKFLFWFLFNNHISRRTLHYQNKTTGIINLQTHRYLTEAFISLPPLPVQEKIAAILDQADTLRKKDRELLARYEALQQSIFYDMFGDPVRNERRWDKKCLNEFGDWRSGGTPSRNIPAFFIGDIPWITSGELNELYIADSIEKISEEAIKNSNAKKIEPFSILLGMYDTAALKSSINIRTVACNQAIRKKSGMKNFSEILSQEQ